MADDNHHLRRIRTLDDLQEEKKRLKHNVELAKAAFVDKAQPSAWISSAKVSLGGLLVTSLLLYGLRSVTRRTFSDNRRSRKKNSPEVQPLKQAATYAFLMPLVRKGVSLLIDRIEDRLEDQGRRG